VPLTRLVEELVRDVSLSSFLGLRVMNRDIWRGSLDSSGMIFPSEPLLRAVGALAVCKV